jgi:hypothetical protein
VLRLGEETGLPVVAGGDRHGREPNAILSLSRAATFPEFVHEVRNQRFSHLVFMPQYREPLKMRILQVIGDVLRDYPENLKTGRRWCDRVFYRESGGTTPIPLAEMWNGNSRKMLQQITGAATLLEWRGIRSALRFVLDDTATVWQTPVLHNQTE